MQFAQKIPIKYNETNKADKGEKNYKKIKKSC